MTDIHRFVQYLSRLELNPAMARIKTIEVDLKGRLNPTIWLNHVFFTQQKWLNFNEFFTYYITHNEAELRETFAHVLWEELRKGLEARIYRTQFGMLTEYQAFFLCKEVFGDACVTRNADLDRIGVDFQLTFNGQLYNIHIFVDTQRAWEFRKFKKRHKQSDRVQGLHVNLPYALAPNRFNSLEFLPNGFGVYTRKYLEYLRTEIMLGHIKHDNIVGTHPLGFVYKT